ncbi:MAG: hypothetical protein AB3N20_11310 [Rhizobiaceae bacterium]
MFDEKTFKGKMIKAIMTIAFGFGLLMAVNMPGQLEVMTSLIAGGYDALSLLELAPMSENLSIRLH